MVMPSAVMVDRFRVGSESEAREVARRGLAGELGALPTDHSPHEGLFRAYEALVGTPWATAYADEILAHLTSPDEAQRRGAVLFAERHGTLANVEALIAALESARALFRDVGTLEDSMLRAVAAHLIAGDAKARAFAEREVLAPDSRPEALIAALTKSAPDWVTARAPEIVHAHPDAALPILFNLQMLGRDVTSLGVALAPDAKRSQSFCDMYERFLDHPEPIRQALALAP